MDNHAGLWLGQTHQFDRIYLKEKLIFSKGRCSAVNAAISVEAHARAC